MNKIHINMKNLIREFNHFFNNGKVWVFFFLFAFLIHIYFAPVINFSIAARYKMSPWGILFLFSSVYFDLFFLLGATYLYSKVPFLERWQMYQHIRYGKTRWGLVQIAKIVLSAIAYTIVTMLTCIILLIKNLRWENGWGKIWHTLALTDAGEQFNMEFPISYQLINQNKIPFFLLCKAIIIISLVVMVIGLTMFLLSICFSRLISIIVSIGLSLLLFIIEELDFSLKQVLVEIIPTEWIKINKIENSILGVNSLGWTEVTVRLVLYVIILSGLVIIRIRRMEYHWYGEE